MIKVGLTGGIGSGKTVVASLLELMGIPVYIADEESKRLTDTSPSIHDKLTAIFGENIYTSSGLDRKLLASYIFNDTELLHAVNQIIHPEVNRHFLNWAAQQTTDICVIESAILFESGFDKIVDIRLMVYAPLEIRITRACQRNSDISPQEIKKRIENQLPDEQKKEWADYTILNDNITALTPQVQDFISFIRSR
ncbi:dephospho-CoA kinase [Parabacteroides sp. 52]|uniref:dephospho-CoA kinase n=1 Tax=unclassified Parabacteroides TaxID=2649774 RepID=UPI0013D09F9F|nr:MULTISPECIES: dephospho-CoA kinase [unclassified Parabacteroides]MDH6534509.1 dephospho-CoA kinase [Parabacteroides sp. PM5-20]NDV55040.1 dephospho-CoA kinase [Parabacteroides sp. 52]